MNKYTSRIGTSLLVAIMKGKHTWSTRLPPLIHDGGGLYLQPREGGGGVWKFRYTKDGKPTFAGLGRLEDVPAPEARRQRDALKSKLHGGGDPVRERQREAAIERAKGSDLSTFAAVVENWLASPRVTTKPAKHRAVLAGIARNHVIPALGKLVVDDITGDHIIRLIGKLQASASVQQRVMYVILKSINFANAARPVTERCANPAADPLVKEAIGTGRQGTPHAKMAVKDVPAFMARLWANKSVTGLGMMAIVLTGLRANEALGGQWPEIQGDLWTVPGDDERVEGRMKAKEGKARPQYIPVSPGLKMVLDTLRDLRRSTDDFIFPGKPGQPIVIGSMWKVLKDYKASGVTTHGFRSTLIDFAKAKGVPVDVREAMLHHVAGGARGHYDYSSGQDDNLLAHRIAPMKAWSDHCTSAIPAEQRRLRVVA
jgi:integrase